jgi:hypothetical protein
MGWVVLCLVALMGLVAYVFVDPWLQTQGFSVRTDGEWHVTASGWQVLVHAWPVAAVSVLLAGVLWVPLSLGLRWGSAQLQERFRTWQEQRELDAGRQALAELPQARAQLRGLEKRLKDFQGLEARERAASEAEVQAQTRLAQAEAQAQARLARAEREAQRRLAQAQATLTDAQQKVATWTAELTATKQAQAVLKARQRYLEKLARRLQRELRQAKQEGREPDLALVKRCANRLLKFDDHPETPRDEQASPASQRG